MPNGDPRYKLFYPTLTLMIDSYNLLLFFQLKEEKPGPARQVNLTKNSHTINQQTTVLSVTIATLTITLTAMTLTPTMVKAHSTVGVMIDTLMTNL